MVMLDFICMGSADLFGTGRERKIQNENMSPAGFEPTPRHTTTGNSALKTTRPRRLDGDQLFNVLQDNGIQINKPLRDNTTSCQIDYGNMCI